MLLNITGIQLCHVRYVLGHFLIHDGTNGILLTLLPWNQYLKNPGLGSNHHLLVQHVHWTASNLNSLDD